MSRAVLPIVLLAAGLGLIYWAWASRGREEGMTLGLFLVIVSVPLFLLYAFTRDGW